jgi:hypothetical protein
MPTASNTRLILFQVLIMLTVRKAMKILEVKNMVYLILAWFLLDFFNTKSNKHSTIFPGKDYTDSQESDHPESIEKGDMILPFSH